MPITTQHPPTPQDVHPDRPKREQPDRQGPGTCDWALALWLAVLLGLTWWIYQPAIPGPFLLDDFENLGQLEVTPVENRESLLRYLGDGHAGPSGRPVAKLSFLIDDQAWPSQADGFKRTNLLIHLLVGVTLFAAGRLMLRPLMATHLADWAALGATALWLLHPLQVSTVMYVVQRMTELSALFVAAGVFTHVWLRMNPRRNPWLQLSLLTASLAFFGVLATASKENGVLLPLFLLIVEATLPAGTGADRFIAWWRRVCLMLPSAVLMLYVAYLPRWMPSYARRDFTLAERLLTEPVVVMDYLYHLVSLRVSGLGLYQDDFQVTSSAQDPAALLALAVLGGALAVALAIRKSWPLVSFGVLWFLAGHLLESTTIPLELYFEHRNYLPLFGPALATLGLLALAFGRLPAATARLGIMLPVLFIMLAGANTWGYAREWGDKQRLLTVWALEHPDSPRAQLGLTIAQAEAGFADAALDTVDAAYARFPEDMAFPLLSIDIACATDRTLRYDLRELADRVEDHRWSIGLRTVVENLSAGILDTACREYTTDLHQLVWRLLDLPDSELHRSAMAATLKPSGELYLREGNADEALQLLKVVDMLRPRENTALRIASVYLLAREYPLALEALAVARERALAGAGWQRNEVEQRYAQLAEHIESLERAASNHPAIQSEAPAD